VLGAFAVEPDPGRETLERYLKRYPDFAGPLVDLSRELHRELFDSGRPLSPDEKAYIDAAWRRHIAAIGAQPLIQTDLFAALSTQQLRDLAKTLDVPRQVITAFRDRLVLIETVPRRFLERMAAAIQKPRNTLTANFAPVAFAISTRSYKADAKPTASQPVAFERLLIDAGVSDEKRARLLADSD
jgi:hypothetical protein